ncbi:MAG: phosphotransferase [bacterium]|nr:phosphotransferase [bacterium]
MEDIDLICKLNKEWQPQAIKIKKAGGQTNRNYIVQYKDNKFFVRLPWERTDIVDRRIEAENITAVSKCKKLSEITPRCFLYIFKGKNILSPKEKFDPSTSLRPSTPRFRLEEVNPDLPDGTMIMEYIEGKDIDGKDLENSKIQNALLKALHIFHTSGVKFVNIYDVFRDEMAKYKKKAKKYSINKLIAKERIKEIEEIEKAAKENLVPSRKISTHNDLIFENLRLGKNGKVYLLDFEYAGFNVRDGLHYDLGIILGGNLFQKNPIKIKTFEELLKKAKKIYEKDLDDYKIYYGALTNILVMFWWGLVKYFSSTAKEEKRYFRKYVLDRIKGIEFLYKIIGKK